MILEVTTNWGNAWTMAGVGILLVFLMLVLLVFVLLIFGQIMKSLTDKPAKVSKVKEVKNTSAPTNGEITDEILVAIGMALKLSGESVHDEESGVLRINNANSRHSAWCSKMHGINNLEI